MKKLLRVVLWGVGIPIGLCLLLSVAIYLPFIQRPTVRYATRVASESTGLQVSIGQIALRFPLQVRVGDVAVCTAQGDTLLKAGGLLAHVRLFPLLFSKVEVDEVSVNDALVDTRDLVAGMHLYGKWNKFSLSSHSTSLAKSEAVVSHVWLEDADVQVCYADTMPPDTADTEPLEWKIKLERAGLKNVGLSLQMPNDSMGMQAHVAHLELSDALADLHEGQYDVSHLSLMGSSLKLDLGQGEPLPAFDPNHIALTGLDIEVDSVHLADPDIRAHLVNLALKERSGLQVTSGHALVDMNSQHLSLTDCALGLPYSQIRLKAMAERSALQLSPSAQVTARLDARIGKNDLLQLLCIDDSVFRHDMPNEALRMQVSADGCIDHLTLHACDVALPNAFSLAMAGEALHALDSVNRQAHLDMQLHVDNLAFVAGTNGGFGLPQGMNLLAGLSLQGDRVQVDAQYHRQPDDTLAVAHLSAQYAMDNEAYQAQLELDHFDAAPFMQSDSICKVSMSVAMSGCGLDWKQRDTWAQVHCDIGQLQYAQYHLDNTMLDLRLKQQRIGGEMMLDNKLCKLQSQLVGHVRPNEVGMRLVNHFDFVDWQALALADRPLSTSHDLTMELTSDLNQTHQAKVNLCNNEIKAERQNFHTKDLFLDGCIRPDSTGMRVQAGDLQVQLAARHGLEDLLQQVGKVAQCVATQWEDKDLNHAVIRQLLPDACLRVTAHQDNPLYNILAMNHVEFDHLLVDFDTSPDKGLNGTTYLHGLHSDTLMVDTIYLNVQQDTASIHFQGGAKNGAQRLQHAFNLAMQGGMNHNNAQLLTNFTDQKGDTAFHLGVQAELRKRGIRAHFFPQTPILLYHLCSMRGRNVLFLSNRGRMYGDVRMYDEDGSGVEFYTVRPDSLMERDFTVSLQKVKLNELQRLSPLIPAMGGLFSMECHYADYDHEISISTDTQLADFSFKDLVFGSWQLGAVYLPSGDDEHYVEAYVQRDGTDVLNFKGSYQGTPQQEQLDARLDLNHFPLNVLNPFMPDGLCAFDGRMNGHMQVSGPPDAPMANGQLVMDKTTLTIPMLSAFFSFSDAPLTVNDSRLRFDNFNIYSSQSDDNHVSIDGMVDFSNLANALVDLRLKSESYELINAPKKKNALVYGKILVGLDTSLRGPVDNLEMRGNLDLLGQTDFTFVMLNSPLTVSDRLGEMVTFVDFSQPEEETAPSVQLGGTATGGLDILLNMHIDQSVQARIDLNADGSNYLLLEGGGDLSFGYAPDGKMTLRGRYELNDGEMRYTVPVIPLRTFKVKNGSSLNWNGDLLNPEMDITATERIRSRVGATSDNTRMVGFDVGLHLTERLNNLGMKFVLSAPEDVQVQEGLLAKSEEEINKLAVTMLVTGIYMADDNAAGNLDMNNALNAFLQSEISNIAGKALDLDLGMENVDNNGNSQTNYNFQFSKRLWNNRVRIVIGGTVSTGNSANQDDTFIDNVAIEYRLDDSGTRYVRLFHDKNTENILEGEIIETGAGVVLRKKVDNVGELFIFKKK